MYCCVCPLCVHACVRGNSVCLRICGGRVLLVCGACGWVGMGTWRRAVSVREGGTCWEPRAPSAPAHGHRPRPTARPSAPGQGNAGLPPDPTRRTHLTHPDSRARADVMCSVRHATVGRTSSSRVGVVAQDSHSLRPTARARAGARCGADAVLSCKWGTRMWPDAVAAACCPLRGKQHRIKT